MANETPVPPASTCDDQLTSTLADIAVMLRHSRRLGLTIPDSLKEKLATLCYGQPDAAAADTTPPPATPVTAPLAQRDHFSTALAIHGALSQLVAPATATTISSSETLNGKIVGNPTLRLLLRASMFSLGGFIVITVVQEILGDTGAVPWLAQIFDTLVLIASAGLGSGFYGLYTAHKYIVRSTFDPRYEQTYFVRFFLGLTSGTILGYFGKYLLDPSASNENLQQLLGPPVLALLGGYASEAVSQILGRVAETLVTIVRGSDADLIQARQDELNARVKQTETQLKADLLLPLQEARTLAVSGASPDQVKAALQKAFDAVKS